jgi:hypothetical protein
MKNNWTVTILFPDMPEDADENSMLTLLNALLDSNGEIEYKIITVKKVS